MYLQDITITKREEVDQAASDFKTRLLDGQIDWRQALLQKKMVTDLIDAIFKDDEVKDYLESEFKKEGVKEIDYEGCAIKYISKRNAADFSRCNDKILERLESDEHYMNISEQIKERQETLKKMTKSIDEVDPETGETFTKYPAAFTTSDYFQVSLLKSK